MNPGASSAIADQAVADLIRLQAVILRDVNRSLLRLDTQSGSDKLVKQVSVNAQAARQIDDILVRAGLESVMQQMSIRAQESIKAVIGEADIPADASRELAQIVRGQQAQVADLFAEASDKIRQAINLGTSSGASLFDLTEAVAKQLDTTFSRARSAVDTAIMSAGRASIFALVADAGLDDIVYLYSGPMDKITRPFCAEYINKAYTEKFISTLDNKQGLPVAESCGGYNCRHTWSPFTRAEAVRRGIPIVG